MVPWSLVCARQQWSDFRRCERGWCWWRSWIRWMRCCCLHCSPCWHYCCCERWLRWCSPRSSSSHHVPCWPAAADCAHGCSSSPTTTRDISGKWDLEWLQVRFCGLSSLVVIWNKYSLWGIRKKWISYSNHSESEISVIHYLFKFFICQAVQFNDELTVCRQYLCTGVDDLYDIKLLTKSHLCAYFPTQVFNIFHLKTQKTMVWDSRDNIATKFSKDVLIKRFSQTGNWFGIISLTLHISIRPICLCM